MLCLLAKPRPRTTPATSQSRGLPVRPILATTRAKVLQAKMSIGVVPIVCPAASKTGIVATVMAAKTWACRPPPNSRARSAPTMTVAATARADQKRMA